MPPRMAYLFCWVPYESFTVHRMAAGVEDTAEQAFLNSMEQ